MGKQEKTFTLVVVYFIPWPLVVHFGDRPKEWVLGDPLQFAGTSAGLCAGWLSLRCPAPLSPWPWAVSLPNRLGTQSPMPAHSPGQLERPGLTCCLHTALQLLFMLPFPSSAASHHGCLLSSSCARSLMEGPCVSEQPAHSLQSLFGRMCHKEPEHSWLALFRHTDFSMGISWQVSCVSV